ncbi:MAG: 23S rRNA (pseudouridine(1915)-N(3))-methyltransferase RlmH [Candidatus Aminicenantes bacterium]|nr:MAG: 23S rRNA (pseudouridine(1915)-N(3))-methyltransferase RlmH [Candidatus Aminicenantes bacterium]
MRIKILWPGKTRDHNIKELQDSYLAKIKKLEKCEVIETKEARGLTEPMEKRILAIEANGLEKHMKDDYIICLFDKGKEMDSEEFARFLQDKKANSAHTITFIVGGFLGLADGILKRAHFLLSLSKMTFSHELTRVVLLEQIYRSLTIMHGRQYAK